MYNPSKYKPPQTCNAKTPLLNRPSKYKPPGGLGNCPQMQNFLPTMRLAQSILTCKFPSMDKPLDQKGPLKNITPWAYFRNFVVLDVDRIN